MNSTDLKIAIKTAYHTQEPLFIWGPPGIGKSDVVAQAAHELGEELSQGKKPSIKSADDFQLIDFRMALRDPTDIKGFPMPDAKDKTMKFFRDAELPTDGFGILFMDELVSAAPATQAAGMQLTLKNHRGEHAIGDYVLPKGFTIIAAGNRETDRGVVHRMPTPLANRFTHVDAEVDPKAWVQYALSANLSPELVAFIRLKEDLLFKFDPKLDSKAFPTPRSWVRTERFVHQEIPDSVKMNLIKGTVGDGPGSEYWAFRKLVDELPTLEEIRLEPKKTKVPGEDKMSARYAIATMLGANTSDATIEPFIEYTERMDKELQVMFMRDAITRDPKLRTNKVYLKWALKNSDVILSQQNF